MVPHHRVVFVTSGSPRDDLQEVVTCSGAEVQVLVDPEEAVLLLEPHGTPALLLADPASLRPLAALEDHPRSPGVLLVALVEQEAADVVRQALADGADDVVSADPEALARRLPVLLERLRARAAHLAHREELARRLLESDRLATVGQLHAAALERLESRLEGAVLNLEYIDGELEAAGVHSFALERAREQLRDASDDIERSERALRELARSTRGCDRDRPWALDPHEILENALCVAEPALRDKLRVSRLYGTIPRAAANADRLQQVFVNLLLHAAAVGDRREGLPELSIRSRADSRSVVIDIVIEPVADDAGEVPPDVRRWIARTTSSALGGTLEETRTEDQLRWRVRLPAAHPSLTPLPAPDRVPRVLLVSDDVATAVWLRDALEGAEPSFARSVEDALRMLRRDPGFDVVVCDLAIEDRSGLALHRRVASRSPALARRFVIVGTPEGEEEQYVRAVGLPVIATPDDPRSLRGAVREVSANA